MKLRKVIVQLETQTCINAETFAELKKRKKQVKSYFDIEKIEGVAEIIGNALTMYYIDIEELGISDLIYNNDLQETCETGACYGGGYMIIGIILFVMFMMIGSILSI